MSNRLSPKPHRGSIIRALPCLLLVIVTACQQELEIDSLAGDIPEVNPTLAAHTGEFEQQIYRVTDQVSVAVGYGLANSILVQGQACNFIVDVMGSVEAAQAVYRDFQAISNQPVAALIYTHNHADHVFGGAGFRDSAAESPDVYSHSTTEYYINRVVNILRPILSERSGHMFGSWLQTSGPNRRENDGIGPFLEIGQPGHSVGLIRPNRTFSDTLDTEICGVRVHLEHAPGETNDQILVWLPDSKVLLPGDNVYKAFPNLYTIRGTLYRDVMAWVASLDRMRDLKPRHLVPSHTRPVSGQQQIQSILTAYRDAIQFVHDQTIRGMNQGQTPDRLAQTVRLPQHLAEHPYLQELYGTVAWSVRNIFNGYLGWFDGDAASLEPAAPEQRARGMIELAGDETALLAKARLALDNKQAAWAAELANAVLILDPQHSEAQRLKAGALTQMGRLAISPNGRNYYLSQARDLLAAGERDSADLESGVRSLLAGIPIGQFIQAMPTRLNPDKSADQDIKVNWQFRDTGEAYSIHVRRGIAQVSSGAAEDAVATIITNTQAWRDIATGQLNPAVALASSDTEVDGSKLKLISFLGLFDD